MPLIESMNVKDLDLYGCAQVSDPLSTLSSLRKVQVLTLCNRGIQQISGIENLKELQELRMNMTSLQSWEGLSLCTKLKKIVIGHIHLPSLTFLRHIHSIELQDIHGLVDVSPLANVHTLVLKWGSVVNVNCLARVRNLTLHELRSVSDVSDLLNVEYLKISYCDNIRHWGKLMNISSRKVLEYSMGELIV